MTTGTLRRILIGIWLLNPPVAFASDHAVLFIGNSYTSANAPDSLEQSYMKLVQEGMPQYQDVSVARYAPGGYTLAQHLQDATSGTQLDSYLHDAIPEHQWDYVVVHEQSQIPGFPQSEPQWQTSKNAALSLSEIIAEKGSETRLMMTWARRDGDSGNMWLYPDYPTMQAHLADGYQAYTEAIDSAGQKVALIPVGLGWQQIYDELLVAGLDPLGGDTLFQRLYSADGSHPSPHGTYLAACIVYGAITEQSPVGLQWSHGSIGAEDRLALQKVSEALLGLGENDANDMDGGDIGESQDARPEPLGVEDAGLTDRHEDSAQGGQNEGFVETHGSNTEVESTVGPQAQDILVQSAMETTDEGGTGGAEFSQAEPISESPADRGGEVLDTSYTSEQPSSGKGGCASFPRRFPWSFLLFVLIGSYGFRRRCYRPRTLA
jgi:hypothetical protein